MLKKGFVAGGLVLALTVTALAAGKNLQHFPKDISDADLKKEMTLQEVARHELRALPPDDSDA